MNNIFKSIFAGILIGIGCNIYNICPNRIVGAGLFSLGLYFICLMGLNLYTGKVGFIENTDEIEPLIYTLIGNFVGTALCAIFSPIVQSPEYWQISAPMLFAKSYMTGILMFLAVWHYKYVAQYRPLGIFLCVPCFLLSGFRHCIADMFYFWCSADFGNIWCILVAIVGNTLGSLTIRRLNDLCYSD